MQAKKTFSRKITVGLRKIMFGLGIATSAAILATTAIAQTAAQTGDPAGVDCREGHHHAWKQGDRQAAMQKHLDKLKADLNIQPNQQGAWQAYVSQVQTNAQKMQELHAQAKAAANLTLPERLDQRNTVMQQRLADMQAANTALKALYASLTPAQQTIMDQRFSYDKRHHA